MKLFFTKFVFIDKNISTDRAKALLLHQQTLVTIMNIETINYKMEK